MTDKDLVQAIDRAARMLPLSQVEALAGALEPFSGPSGSVRSKAMGMVPTPAFGELARGVLDAWEAVGEGQPGPGLALALRTAARSSKEERDRQAIDIVWTGPNTGEVPVRLTREALLDVIRAARMDLFIVSFAAYKVEAIVEAISEAADRGVKVRLILETAKAEGGTLTFGAAASFDEVRDKVLIFEWPAEKRPILDHGRASLHAKTAVADDHVALVTSANLTGLAISENMELGLLIRGGPVPGRLRSHFAELIARGYLVEVL